MSGLEYENNRVSKWVRKKMGNLLGSDTTEDELQTELADYLHQEGAAPRSQPVQGQYQSADGQGNAQRNSQGSGPAGPRS